MEAEYSFLIIAFYLSILSYYLGVLVYSLPIPFYGLKKWAPTLMIDGIFSASLIFAYTLILSLIDYFGKMLGGDWESFYIWLGLKTSIVVTLLVVLKFIGASLSLGGLQFLANSLIASLIKNLTTVLFLLTSLSIIGTVIITYGGKILALGILLHSVPFRLTRVSGSMMISIVIVFSVGLPLMPIYVEALSRPPGFNESILVEYGVAYGYISVADIIGNPVPFVVTEIYDDNKNTLLARYAGNSSGVVDASSPDKGFPAAKTYYIRLDCAGVYLWREVDPLRDYGKYDDKYNLSIEMPVIVIQPLRLLYLENGGISKVNTYSDNVVSLTINATGNSVLYVIIGYNDDVYTFIDSVLSDPNVVIAYNWYGASFKALKYYLNEGLHRIRVYIRVDSLGTPSVDEVYYMRDTAQLYYFEPTDLVKPIVYIVFNLFVAPLTYIAILFSASIALAKVLGGASVSLARAILLGV